MSGWTALADDSDAAGAAGAVDPSPFPSLPLWLSGRDGPETTSAGAESSQGAISDTPVEGLPKDLQAWTRAIRRGDEAAFTQFHELYSLRLYRYLLVLSRGNEFDAHEVLQTVIVKLASRFEVFHEEKRLWAWLCRLARNACVDAWRSRNRDQRFVALDAAGDTMCLEACRAEGHLAALLQDVLAGMPEDDQELLRSAYLDRRPLRDLAHAAGQSYKALESRLARLRQKVKNRMLSHLRHENPS